MVYNHDNLIYYYPLNGNTCDYSKNKNPDFIDSGTGMYFTTGENGNRVAVCNGSSRLTGYNPFGMTTTIKKPFTMCFKYLINSLNPNFSSPTSFLAVGSRVFSSTIHTGFLLRKLYNSIGTGLWNVFVDGNLVSTATASGASNIKIDGSLNAAQINNALLNSRNLDKMMAISYDGFLRRHYYYDTQSSSFLVNTLTCDKVINNLDNNGFNFNIGWTGLNAGFSPNNTQYYDVRIYDKALTLSELTYIWKYDIPKAYRNTDDTKYCAKQQVLNNNEFNYWYNNNPINWEVNIDPVNLRDLVRVTKLNDVVVTTNTIYGYNVKFKPDGIAGTSAYNGNTIVFTSGGILTVGQNYNLNLSFTLNDRLPSNTSYLLTYLNVASVASSYVRMTSTGDYTIKFYANSINCYYNIVTDSTTGFFNYDISITGLYKLINSETASQYISEASGTAHFSTDGGASVSLAQTNIINPNKRYNYNLKLSGWTGTGYIYLTPTGTTEIAQYKGDGVYSGSFYSDASNNAIQIKTSGIVDCYLHYINIYECLGTNPIVLINDGTLNNKGTLSSTVSSIGYNVLGNGILFDGSSTSARIQVDTLLPTQTAYTFVAKYYQNNLGVSSTPSLFNLADSTNSYFNCAMGSNFITCFGTTVAGINNTFTADHMIAIRNTSNNVKNIYLDSNNIFSSSAISSGISSARVLLGNNNTYNANFNGKIYYFKMWDTALSDDQLRQEFLSNFYS